MTPDCRCHRDGSQCTECARTAMRNYMARRRFRTGEQHDPRRCRDCGSVFADHACHLERP